MTTLRLLFLAFLLVAANGHAQTPGEIAFWETVRDSKNPAELRAYLQRFPNGVFVPIAEARLAALEKAPAQPAPPAARPQATPVAPVVAAVPSGKAIPQVGDTWTYRLTYPKRWGVPTPTPSVRTHVVRVEASSDQEIVDQVLVDGQTAASSKHSRGSFLLTQGVSIFSPYLAAFADLSRPGALGNVTITEGSCRSTHACTARARVAGTENVQTAAGPFAAIKIIVDQSWRPGPSATAFGQNQMAQMNGGRTLTVWYAPQAKRAVKFSSRHSVGDITPFETHFDLELVSYQVK